MTTGTLHQNGFKLSEVTTLKEEPGTVLSEFEADHAFDLLMSDVDGYSPPELQSTLQDKLQEITMLNDIDEVTLEDTLVTPISGIEANDVCSLYKQFMEYEQASDEALSYPESSLMSPVASPGEQSEDVVLGRLMSVQEKLIEEVGIGEEDDETNDVDIDVIDVVNDNDNLVVALPNEDKILRTINGVHPKTNLIRMADSPKFAKFKKKRLTNEPPLRNLSLPNTPRCTSPSDMVSQEERKHMEIKLIEALALPVTKNMQNGKNGKKDALKPNKKNIKEIAKKLAGVCATKRKHPSVEPIPSRLIPVVSKRFKNNVEQSKSLKDPRLKEKEQQMLNIDPRLNKLDYGVKSNVTQLKNTNLNELNSSTNTATETVDDMCVIDMTIEHETGDAGIVNMTINHENDFIGVTDMTLVHENDVAANTITTVSEKSNFDNVTIDHDMLAKTTVSQTNNIIADLEQVKPNGDTCVTPPVDDEDELKIVFNDEDCLKIVFNDDGETVLVNGANETLVNGNVINDRPTNESDCKINGSDACETEVVSSGTCGTAVNGSCKTVVVIDDLLDDNSSDLRIVEFPSLAAIEIKTEDCVTNGVDETTNYVCNGTEKVTSNGLIKPKRNYRKGRSKSKTPTALNGTCSSDSENECDDDDRAYNRKLSKKSKNSRTISSSHIKNEKSRSRSSSKTPSVNNSRPSSRQHSKSPSRIRSTVSRRRRSESPGDTNTRSDRRHSNERYEESDEESEFSYHSDRSNVSDCENMDISNKLIELSNPVPYDIEHERKLRFLSGHASKGMGERRNIYAGGITEDTTKAELADRFRRFGKITKITLHFREKGDNYAFIVFEEPDYAMRAIEEGNDDPTFPHLDLCFGGRRRFVGGSYVDFDGNNRFLEEQSDKGTATNNRAEGGGDDDFDRLLQMALTDSKKVKKENSPEWT